MFSGLRLPDSGEFPRMDVVVEVGWLMVGSACATTEASEMARVLMGVPREQNVQKAFPAETTAAAKSRKLSFVDLQFLRVD